MTFHGAFCSKGLQPGGTRERTPKGIGWRDSLEAFQEPFLLDPEPRLGELHFPLEMVALGRRPHGWPHRGRAGSVASPFRHKETETLAQSKCPSLGELPLP